MLVEASLHVDLVVWPGLVAGIWLGHHLPGDICEFHKECEVLKRSFSKRLSHMNVDELLESVYEN